jgi:hypothetical protein
VQQIIDLNKNAPLEFPPGTKWHYSNTGYILLGAIIEKVSGLSYGEFIRTNIFEPIGMKHSYSGSNSALIRDRASGYSRGPNGWVNAQYLSMTQPHAAGALMSSVDDLALWDAAVSSGKLLSKDSWDRAFTGYKLANGEDTHYGYGWQTDAYDGHPIIRHSGGIFGYASQVTRLPRDRVYVAMLTNTDFHSFDLGFVTTELAAVSIGDPYHEPTAIALNPASLDSYTGIYRIDDAVTRTVTREGDRLYVQRTGGPKVQILASSEHEFFVKDSFVRLSFERDASGAITGMTRLQQDGSREVAQRTDKPLPSMPVAIDVSPEVLARYIGDYQLAPGFVLTITLEGGHLMTQATGQPKVEVFAKSESEFFLRVVDAQISFVADESGKIEKLILHQGGRDIPALRVK